MGYNSSKYDKEAQFAAMSTRKLEDMVKFWIDAKHRTLTKYGNSIAEIHLPMVERELEYCKMKLAERIGKK